MSPTVSIPKIFNFLKLTVITQQFSDKNSWINSTYIARNPVMLIFFKEASMEKLRWIVNLQKIHHIIHLLFSQEGPAEILRYQTPSSRESWTLINWTVCDLLAERFANKPARLKCPQQLSHRFNCRPAGLFFLLHVFFHISSPCLNRKEKKKHSRLQMWGCYLSQ